MVFCDSAIYTLFLFLLHTGEDGDRKWSYCFPGLAVNNMTGVGGQASGRLYGRRRAAVGRRSLPDGWEAVGCALAFCCHMPAATRCSLPYACLPARTRCLPCLLFTLHTFSSCCHLPAACISLPHATFFIAGSCILALDFACAVCICACAYPCHHASSLTYLLLLLCLYACFMPAT
jgi:hypothetical protein